MDVVHFFKVLRRFKKVVIGGTLTGAVLAVLAYGQPTLSHGKPTIVPRGAEIWQAQSEILITQGNDPYGRSLPVYSKAQSPTGGTAVPIGGQQLETGLAPVVATLANGDAFRERVKAAARVPGTFTAAALEDMITSNELPFVTLTASAPTRSDAILVAARAANVLRSYEAQQQAAAGVAVGDRLQLQIVQRGLSPVLEKGHKPTIPVLVFFVFIIGSVMLALTLENARIRAASKDDPMLAESEQQSPLPAELAQHAARGHNGSTERGGREDRFVSGSA